MACRRDPQLSKNALSNLTEIFRTNGKKTLTEFIEEADSFLDSMNPTELNEVKQEIGHFIKYLSKGNHSAHSKNSTGTRKRKRSAGGAWQPPLPPGPPPGVPVYFRPPIGQPAGVPMGMGPPVQMPRGPQGPGIARGMIRVGATFLLPRSTTGVIYAGLWLGIVLLAGFAEQQHHDFLMMGIEQITSGNCMGTMGIFDVARHPLCTRWRELMVPMLTALNEVMKLNMRALGVLTAGVGVVVTVPLAIDAVVYELAFNIDYVLTTALQSFTGRPLIPPLRSMSRPSLPALAGRMLSLVNPAQVAGLAVGQSPNMTQQLGYQQFMPPPGQAYFQPVYGQPAYERAAGYDQLMAQQAQQAQFAAQQAAQWDQATPWMQQQQMAQQMPQWMPQQMPQQLQPQMRGRNDDPHRRRSRSRGRSRSRSRRRRNRDNGNY
jgi:hypothetical protein